jgi:hypothetical protein
MKIFRDLRLVFLRRRLKSLESEMDFQISVVIAYRYWLSSVDDIASRIKITKIKIQRAELVMS